MSPGKPALPLPHSFHGGNKRQQHRVQEGPGWGSAGAHCTGRVRAEPGNPLQCHCAWWPGQPGPEAGVGRACGTGLPQFVSPFRAQVAFLRKPLRSQEPLLTVAVSWPVSPPGSFPSWACVPLACCHVTGSSGLAWLRAVSREDAGTAQALHTLPPRAGAVGLPSPWPGVGSRDGSGTPIPPELKGEMRLT